MAKLKTAVRDASAEEFIEEFADTDQKKKDSYALIKIMEKATGCKPKMWGPTMIGFGQYHYKSDRSAQEGDWPLIGFSPRKAAISLYIYNGSQQHAHLLESLGKFKMGKACIYVKKLSDVDLDALNKLIAASIQFLQSKYPVKFE